ncbi:hypothetical protein [Ruminiclostridium cellobioparum]
MNIKNNGYSLAVTKLLGAAKWDLMLQSGIEGILYGIFGAVLAEIMATALNYRYVFKSGLRVQL